MLEIDQISDEKIGNPANQAGSQDLRRFILGQISDRRSRMVVELYEFEGMTMQEIGPLLQMSESRVSQIYSAALRQMRDSVALRKFYEAG